MQPIGSILKTELGAWGSPGSARHRFLPTGLTAFDRQTYGLNRGDVVVTAGPSGAGATAFALNVTAHALLQERQNIVLVSLDHTAPELSVRLLTCVSRVNRYRLHRRELDDREQARVRATAALMHNAPLRLSALLRPDVDALLYALNDAATKARARLVVVDSVTDLAIPLGGDEREDAIGEVMRGFKALARRTGSTVLATWRLGTDFDVAHQGAAALGDLIGTAVEDADVIACVDRPDLRGIESTPTLAIDLFKNRHGSCGRCKFAFLEDSGAVLNLA